MRHRLDLGEETLAAAGGRGEALEKEVLETDSPWRWTQRCAATGRGARPSSVPQLRLHPRVFEVLARRVQAILMPTPKMLGVFNGLLCYISGILTAWTTELILPSGRQSTGGSEKKTRCTQLIAAEPLLAQYVFFFGIRSPVNCSSP